MAVGAYVLIKIARNLKPFTMTHAINLMLINILSIYPLLLSAGAGLALGFTVRLIINSRQKRSLLKLENRMLSNHAQILYLESKLSMLQKNGDEKVTASVKRMR